MPRTPLGRVARALLVVVLACAAWASDLPSFATVVTPVAAQARVQPPAIVPHQLLIGFHATVPDATRDTIAARHGGRIVQRLPGAGAYLVEVPPLQPLGVAAASFAEDGAVRYVEPNYRYRLAAPPDDPHLGDLWGLQRIAAPTVWETTTGSDEIVVGIVDTGIDHDHVDLAANMWTAPDGWCPGESVSHGFRSIDGVTGCAPADTDDDNGHGTHLAGTIGAVGDNGLGIVGVNWRVKMMSLKFLKANGGGSNSDAIAVLEYAIAAKQAGVNLRVLNLGWNDLTHSEALLAALEAVNAAGILVVAGAGNAGTDNDLKPNYPASYGAAPDYLPNIIAVTGTDASDLRALGFNYGTQSVHIAAPGDTVLSTVPGGSYDYIGSPGDTASAAAHVSGAAALLLSAPDLDELTVGELKTRLVSCGDVLAVQSKTLTNRRLNVARAFSLTDCAPPSYTVGTRLSPANSGTVTVSPVAASYLVGTEVTITATPGLGYRFAGWEINGASGTTANPLVLDITASLIVTALFVPETYTLTLSSSGGGQATATPSADAYALFTPVRLDAFPDPGSLFTGWTIDGVDVGTNNPHTLVIGRDHIVRANFSAAPSPGTTFTLDLGALGGGNATADLAGPYVAGTKVKLTATAAPGHAFTGWTIDGAPGGTANPLTLTIAANHTVRAHFTPAHLLHLSWTQGGNVRADTPNWAGDSPYPAGTIVTLTATLNSDNIFTGWTIDGGFAGWANPLTLTMDTTHSVVTNFARRRHFTDLPPGPPPYEPISQLAARQIILGYHNGTFGPNDTTQRAQMAALIARAMGWDAEEHDNPFTDDNGIDPNLWRNVGTLAHYGVAKGYGETTFGTFDTVLKVQVISFITRGMVVRGLWVAETSDDPSLYPNVPATTGHRLDLVTYHRNAGAIPGASAAQPWLDWDEPSTRGWFATALWQAIDRHYNVDRVP